MIIRKAEYKDLGTINDIYNSVIPYEISTADMVPYTMEERKSWLESIDRDKYPVYVADIDGTVTGYIYFSPYRPRRLAMRYTAEISYFISQNYRKQGIGSKLMEYAIAKAPEHDFKTLIAILLAHNTPSIKLLEKYGFSKWGEMPGVADFNGQERDHLYYGLKV